MPNCQCPNCGGIVDITATQCQYCGMSIEKAQTQQQQPQPQICIQIQNPPPMYVQQPMQNPQQMYVQQPMQNPQQIYVQQQFINNQAQNVVEGRKVNKVVYLILVLFLGGIGIHHFYAGKNLLGFLYLLFCWTYIPLLLSIIDFFIALFRKTDGNGNLLLK